MSTRWIAIASIALLVAGCRGNIVGTFADGAFYHVRGHYRVRYAAAGAGRHALLSQSDWTLENFVEDRRGMPAHVSPSDRFWTDYSLDAGGRRPARVRAELYDLRFVHRRDGTVLWARTVPLSRTDEDTRLQVIARDYVERAASGSAMTVSLSSAPEARARRFGPRILHEGPAQIDRSPAYYVMFEHIDLDRREAEPGSVGEIFTLVFVRPGATRWRSGVYGGAEWPMLLIFGYASRPEHHETHRADLESLLSRVDIRRVDL